MLPLLRQQTQANPVVSEQLDQLGLAATKSIDRAAERILCQALLHYPDLPSPATNGAVFNMLTGKAAKLLTRHQWCDGDVAQLEAAVDRLWLSVPEG